MAKTLEDLEKSRQIREQVIAKYGCVPTSIIEPDYNWGKHVIELDSRKQQAVAQKKHEKMDYDKKLSKAFSMSSQNVRGKGAGLSTFPPDLCRKLVQFYSEPGELVLDPMCISGDSIITTLDGDITIKDLVGKENFWVYCSDGKELQIKQAHSVRKTQSNVDVLEVVLDNGVSLLATPNHQFMLRDGSWRDAKDLNENDSLMPIKRSKHKQSGRWQINHNGNYVRQSRFVAMRTKSNYSKKKHVHHIDGCFTNDNPENLECLTDSAHLRLHKLGKPGHPISEKVKIYFKALYTGKGNPFYGKKHDKATLRKIKRASLGRNVGKKHTTDTINRMRNRKDRSEHYIPLVQNLLKEGNLTYREIAEAAKCHTNTVGNIARDKFAYNHKVKEVKKYPNKIDVYNMEVDDFHNFFANGVCVHNCGHNSRMQVCHELGRHYIGYDICAEFMEFNRKVKDEITGKGVQSALFEPTVSITLREQSSEKMVEEDNTMDFALTSPPYWCLTPDTLVVTDMGVIPISELRSNDVVYTHAGEYRRVIGVSSRDVSEEIIKLSVWGCQINIRATKNHKVFAVKGKQCPYYKAKLVCKPNCAYLRNARNITHQCTRACDEYTPQWIAASELTENDFLVYPINTTIKDVQSIKVSDYIQDTRVLNGVIELNHNQYGVNSIPDKVEINNEFMRLAGYYLAEGYSDTSEINFSFHKDKTVFIEDVENCMLSVFGLKSRKSIQENVCHVIFYKTPIASLFKILFGEGAARKHIPSFMMALPVQKQQQLIVGYYYGDGYSARESGYGFTSVSATLIEQIKQILLRMGIISNQTYVDKTGDKSFGDKVVSRHPVHGLSITAQTEIEKFKKHIQHKIVRKDKNSSQIGTPYSFVRNGYLYRPIRKKELVQYSGSVWNCEVEHDNSYTTPLGSVHNCVEYYDDHPDQLGYNKTYPEFLDGIKRVLSETYRVLKPNKYCAWNINDFRMKNVLYPYHADIIRIMQEVGFTLWDCVVVKWQSCLGQAFASQIEERKMFAKSHEYVVTGKKVIK
jgi:intein/homing endonuclease